MFFSPDRALAVGDRRSASFVERANSAPLQFDLYVTNVFFRIGLSVLKYRTFLAGHPENLGGDFFFV